MFFGISVLLITGNRAKLEPVNLTVLVSMRMG